MVPNKNKKSEEKKTGTRKIKRFPGFETLTRPEMYKERRATLTTVLLGCESTHGAKQTKKVKKKWHTKKYIFAGFETLT